MYKWNENYHKFQKMSQNTSRVQIKMLTLHENSIAFNK